MLRAISVLICLATAAVAQPSAVVHSAAPQVPVTGPDYRHVEAADGTILIVVAREDLLACAVTIAMVLNPTVATAEDAPLLASAGSEKAPARCVTEADLAGQ